MGRKPLFEKSRGRRLRWCDQPLRVVGLGRGMAPCMGPMSPILAHSLWVGLVSRKAGKTETKTKAGKTNTLAIKGLLGRPTIESFTANP